MAAHRLLSQAAHPPLATTASGTGSRRASSPRTSSHGNAWLYYQAAFTLLSPADFVLSTHLDKLRTEASAAAPPQLSDGIGVDTPLVVKAAGGAQYYFTSLAVDDSPGPSSLDIAVHLRADSTAPASDSAAAQKHNAEAIGALLAAYPELRKPFHGVLVSGDIPGHQPVTTELPMAEIK